MDCPACGAANPTGQRFCGRCGAPLVPLAPLMMICPACASESPPGQRFCGNCGQALSPPGAGPSVGPPQSAPADPAAFVDGRYQVKKFLGEGGKKRVYLCHDTKLDRDVAFALIKTEGLDEEGHARVQREAQAMGRLGDHPHIVPVHDIGDEGGQPYLVSQLRGGGDVEGLIARAEDHRLPVEQTLRIGDQVCQALEHAHSHGIIHRDLKPGNVWLATNGTAKLGDFGLAMALDRSRLTQAGMMVGTVAYMPPEQATGGEVTQRSDLYSLGCMLYEMVCGRAPFVGEESVAIIGQHLNTPPVAPTWHRPDLPSGLEALILRLLEKDPGKRPDSAAEVRQALAAVSSSEFKVPSGDDSEPATRNSELRDNPLYRRTFVGRENELRQLRAGFDAAASGQGTLTMVVGEPGIGKTALIEQLATYAALRGGKALVGHCYEEGSLSLPYLPFVEALRSYVLTREPDRLRDELGSGAAEVARIISEVRDRVQVELRPAGDPEDDRWRLFQAVTGFLCNAAAVQPILLVLEDLHWADRGTIDFLIHLSRNLAGARLLVVGSYRDVEVDRAHPLSGALAELRRSGDLPRVLLRGLTVDEVHRMINALQGQDVRWSFAEAVYRQTEGSPLFIQEVLRYFVEEGLISRETGRWRRTGEAPPELSIPEGLRDVIGKRLSRLSPECNRLLTVAAVIGREFRLDVLGKVSRVADDDALAALEEGLKVGVLEEQARVGTVLYRFSHAFFRQTLYEELSAARRIRLHQEVGRALEEVHARRLDDHAPELAEHFSHSSDPADLAKAVHYGELGARKAMAVFAHGEAARLLARALEVQEVLDPDDRARRCDLLLALGNALGPAGEPQRVFQEVAEQAFTLAGGAGDRERVARACELAIEAYLRFGSGTIVRTASFRQWVERLDAVAIAGTAARVLADMLLSTQLYQQSRWQEARDLRDRAINAARELSDSDTLFLMVAPPAWVSPGLWDESLRSAREVSDRPREGVRRFMLSGFLANAATTLLAAGERERAEALWGELGKLAEHTQDAELLLAPLVAAGYRALLDGDLEGAVALSRTLIARGDELGSPVAGRREARIVTFRPLLYLGRAEEALAARFETRRGAGRAEEAETWFSLGERLVCLAHLGRFDEARAELGPALERLALTEGDDERPIRLLAPLLETAVLVGDRQAAGLLAPRLADLPGEHSYMTGVALLVGRACALLGDREAARVHYGRALEWANALRFRPEIALTRFALAELLLDESTDDGAAHKSHQEALEHLDFAIDEFRAMKMQPALERALRHKGLLHA